MFKKKCDQALSFQHKDKEGAQKSIANAVRTTVEKSLNQQISWRMY